MTSKSSSERLDLERGLPTTQADVAMLHSLRRAPLDTESYLRMIESLGPADAERLRARPGPARGAPFRLDA